MSRLSDLIDRANEAKNERMEAEAALKSAIARLKKQFGVGTPKEGQALLEKLRVMLDFQTESRRSDAG